MRTSPSIVPPGHDHDVYLVLSDFGRQGRAWAETDEEHTDRETLVRHLLEGQYTGPIRVVSFNTSEGWSRDASEDIAEELQHRCGGEVPAFLEKFIERHGRDVSIQLLLPIGWSDTAPN